MTWETTYPVLCRKRSWLDLWLCLLIYFGPLPGPLAYFCNQYLWRPNFLRPGRHLILCYVRNEPDFILVMPVKLFCNQYLWRPNFLWPSRQIILALCKKRSWLNFWLCLSNYFVMNIYDAQISYDLRDNLSWLYVRNEADFILVVPVKLFCN